MPQRRAIARAPDVFIDFEAWRDLDQYGGGILNKEYFRRYPGISEAAYAAPRVVVLLSEIEPAIGEPGARARSPGKPPQRSPGAEDGRMLPAPVRPFVTRLSSRGDTSGKGAVRPKATRERGRAVTKPLYGAIRGPWQKPKVGG